jgi:hypothetical protein
MVAKTAYETSNLAPSFIIRLSRGPIMFALDWSVKMQEIAFFAEYSWQARRRRTPGRTTVGLMTK